MLQIKVPIFCCQILQKYIYIMVDIYYNNSYNMMVFRNSKQKVYFNKTEGGNMTIGIRLKIFEIFVN